MKKGRITRETILRWLTEQPGLTSREIAQRSGYLAAYASERLRALQRGGFVRCERMHDTATGSERLFWFVDQSHPPLTRKTRPPLPKPREHLVRKDRPQGIAVQLVRRCRAPESDTSIVRQALAAVPALQAAWMGRAGR